MMNMDRPLQGAIVEADFAADTMTFKMHGAYYARAGTYIMLPRDEYERLLNNQRESVDMVEMMRGGRG
jgi:hypothetical protein